MSIQSAISISGLVRGYGKIKVLEGFDMDVEEGSIYGLLGPSGCGKTTLLKVILGRLIPENGQINVLGSFPGEKGSKIPGSAVGYAPQEIALYPDLSIAETLRFHGRLHGMSQEKIIERMDWLIEFLDLPESSRTVGNLSGGQMRRVSLAVALLHEPKLLILDEPTVGVDPELRAKIWEHLVEIANSGVTIILTTHYIDEAGMAGRVGLMRQGKLLAQDSPSNLTQEYGHTSLEETFLHLCKRQKKTEEGES